MMREITSPVGGLNYLESEELLPESDAKILDNWIPDAGYCRLRETELEIVDLSESFA